MLQRIDDMSPARMPTVSVVIPCYKYGHFLTDCVRSVVSQTGVLVRVLIIDDASPDDSADVARSLAREFGEVETVVHTANKGHIATYNEGLLEWANGDYVTLLSADDQLTPGSLERSVSLMEAHPNVGMVYGGIEEFRSTGVVSTTAGKGPGTSIVYEGRRWLSKRCREAVNTVPTPGTILRTEIQHAVGGYDPELAHAGDFDMWLRVAAVADVGYVRGVPQGRYRLHETSMSDGIYRSSLGDIEQRKLVFDSIFGRHGDDLAQIGVDREPTYRLLASQPLWWACRAYEKGTPNPDDIQEWVSFASSTYPEYQRLGAFKALRRRQRLGSRICASTQIFIGTAVVRRLRNKYWWYRWRHFGG